MRLWTIHPKYLDDIGLLSLWREGIGAIKSLHLKDPRKYYNHPQLTRFKTVANPSWYMKQYLNIVWQESAKRGLNFNRKLILPFLPHATLIPVTNRQVNYEFMHLQNKLKERDFDKFIQNAVDTRVPEVNPIFSVYEGEIESWEKVIKPNPKPRKKKKASSRKESSVPKVERT